MAIERLKVRRKGVISLQTIDYTVTAETSQATVEGRPCQNCLSTVKYAYRPGTCVRCHKQWRRDNERRPSYYRSKKTKASYKLTPERKAEMLEEQGWACLICKQIVPRLYVDHCHDTGKIRGLLCLLCNSGLGSFRDDPERLTAAIEYLRSC